MRMFVVIDNKDDLECRMAIKHIYIMVCRISVKLKKCLHGDTFLSDQSSQRLL